MPVNVESDPSTARVYGGETAAERRRQRRARLIAAGIELIGDFGYPQLRVRSLCTHAGLTDRYFYESFATLEDLLVAIYTDIMDTVTAGTLAANQPAGVLSARDQTHQVLAAFFAAVTADPRRARIQLIEIVGVSPTVETTRRAVMHHFAVLIADGVRAWGYGGDDSDRMLTATAVVGAINELLVAWINGETQATVAQLVEHTTRLYLRAFAVPE